MQELKNGMVSPTRRVTDPYNAFTRADHALESCSNNNYGDAIDEG